MLVTVAHNPDAGAGDMSKDQLCEMLHGAGHTVSYVSSKDANWIAALREKCDLVVAAGGDGLVARVAEHLPPGIALAILPLGIANNIARSMGISGTPETLVAGWRHARLRRLDCWLATGAFGKRLLVEGAGLGALTNTIVHFDKRDAILAHPRDLFDQARAALCAMLEARAPINAILSIDGRSLRTDFVLLEIMNLPFVGPSLNLAPAAPDDGWLTIAIADSNHRAALCHWLDDGALGPAPVDHKRCRTVGLHWTDAALRLDDNVLEDSQGRIEIRAADRKIPILVARPLSQSAMSR
jgi:diacylglycerol kinase (ATP)